MDKKDDLRIIKTKMSIKNAFYELIEEKPFSKITVRDIANQAMINRTTFYLHYQDKYELLAQLEDEILNELINLAEDVTLDYIQHCIKNNLPFPHLLREFEYIEKNSAFFKLVANDYSMGSSFYNKVGEQVSQKITTIISDLAEQEMFTRYAKNISISIFSSILNQWVSDDMQDNKEDIAIMLSNIMRSIINYA